MNDANLFGEPVTPKPARRPRPVHRCPVCGRRTERRPRRHPDTVDARCQRCVNLGRWATQITEHDKEEGQP